jgi:uncharacterized membrane protein
MRIISPILLISSLVLLAGCTWGSKPQAPSPYPTAQFNASGEAILAEPKIATGKRYSAKWTEPFWAADITATGVALTRPGETTTNIINYTTTQSQSSKDTLVKDLKGEFFITLSPGKCSDGMSDVVYENTATVLVGAETLTGCALEVK